MGKPTDKPLIGIVGGIASGKSTVAAEFARLGCAVIDADAMVGAVLEEPAVRRDIAQRFGSAVLGADGRVARRRLATQAFAGRPNLDALNAIVHPRVLRRVDDEIGRYQKADEVPAIVLDVPLLVEVGWDRRCDRIVFVDSRWENRIARVRRKGVLTEEDVKIRENFQISLDIKADLADNIIDNNSDFSALVRQIQDIFSDITKK